MNYLPRSGEHPAPRRSADLPVRAAPPRGHAGGEAAAVPVLPAQEVPLPLAQRPQLARQARQSQGGAHYISRAFLILNWILTGFHQI